MEQKQVTVAIETVHFPSALAERLVQLRQRQLDLVQGFILGNGLVGDWKIDDSLTGLWREQASVKEMGQ